ncbi:hypothetical protein TNCV_4567351 [Trichonephila clavipes]|nr:hypothetical protein TNCV_4567351 [Trichonephila clavipes]
MYQSELFLANEMLLNVKYGNLFSAFYLNHTEKGLRWREEHIGWDQQRFSGSNQSYFTVTSDSGHQLVRKRRTRYSAQNVQERYRYRRGMIFWMTKHHIFEHYIATIFQSSSRKSSREVVEEEERWEAPDHSFQHWGGTEENRTVTCLVLKAKANDRRKILVLSHDEFGGSRSDVTVDQVT